MSYIHQYLMFLIFKNYIHILKNPNMPTWTKNSKHMEIYKMKWKASFSPALDLLPRGNYYQFFSFQKVYTYKYRKMDSLSEICVK